MTPTKSTEIVLRFNSGLPPWAWIPVGAGIGMGAGSALGGEIFSVGLGAIIGTGLGVFLYGKSRKSASEHEDNQDK